MSSIIYMIVIIIVIVMGIVIVIVMGHCHHHGHSSSIIRVLAEGLIIKTEFASCTHSIPFGPQHEHPKGFFDWTTRSVPAKHLRFSL